MTKSKNIGKRCFIFLIYFILNVKRKAYKIYNNNTSKTKNNKPKNHTTHNSQDKKKINNTQHTSDVQIINCTAKTINDIINKK